MLNCAWLLVTSWTIALQAPLSMEFSRQEYWSGLPFPSPGDLTDPAIKPGSPAFCRQCFTIWAIIKCLLYTFKKHPRVFPGSINTQGFWMKNFHPHGSLDFGHWCYTPQSLLCWSGWWKCPSGSLSLTATAVHVCFGVDRDVEDPQSLIWMADGWMDTHPTTPASQC